MADNSLSFGAGMHGSHVPVDPALGAQPSASLIEDLLAGLNGGAQSTAPPVPSSQHDSVIGHAAEQLVDDAAAEAMQADTAVGTTSEGLLPPEGTSDGPSNVSTPPVSQSTPPVTESSLAPSQPLSTTTPSPSFAFVHGQTPLIPSTVVQRHVTFAQLPPSMSGSGGAPGPPPPSLPNIDFTSMSHMISAAVAQGNVATSQKVDTIAKEVSHLKASSSVTDKVARESLALSKQNDAQLKSITRTLAETSNQIRSMCTAHLATPSSAAQQGTSSSGAPPVPQQTAAQHLQPTSTHSTTEGAPTQQRRPAAVDLLSVEDEEGENSLPPNSHLFRLQGANKLSFKTNSERLVTVIIDGLENGNIVGTVINGGSAVFSPWDDSVGRKPFFTYRARLEWSNNGREAIVPIHGTSSLYDVAARLVDRSSKRTNPPKKRARRTSPPAAQSRSQSQGPTPTATPAPVPAAAAGAMYQAANGVNPLPGAQLYPYNMVGIGPGFAPPPPPFQQPPVDVNAHLLMRIADSIAQSLDRVNQRDRDQRDGYPLDRHRNNGGRY